MKLLDYSGLQRFLNKIKTLLDSKSNTGHTHTVSDVSGLSTVATSGDYGDLSNTPIIPTVNNAKLTIQKNGTTVKTFTANASSNVTANITVPTAVSELTNDSGYLTSASSLDSSKLTGTIDIGRLPKGALERLVTVADQTARFALTTSDVQVGDTVKQLDTGVMYIVTDESKLSSADGYTEYTAGAATSVPWSGVTGKPSSYTPASHSHGNIANGGTLGTASRALITDGNKKITTSSVTSTELGYVSGVTSAIQTQLNGKAASSHTHTASEVSGLSTVATSGSYNDLSNKPTIDSALSSTSTNAVQNKVINTALAGKAASSHTHTKSQITDFPTKTSQFTNDSHQTITAGTDTTSTATPAHGDTFTCIDSVTKDTNGHVTAVNTKTVTLPADNNTDTKMTQNVSTTNATYPILLCATADATANQGAKTGIFAKSVKVNPSTNVISASGFSGPLTGNVTGNCSGSSGSCTGNAATATQFSANKSVTLTGDVTGTASSKAGWNVATTLANSGVTAGTYGPSADVTGNNNATISVPEITVDEKGRVTSVTNRTLTCKNNTYSVYNKTLTIQKNGTNVATFTSNSNTDVTANITVPTKVSELTNDSGFLTSHQSLSNYVTLDGAQTISGGKTLVDYWHLQAKNLKAGEGETYGRTGYSLVYTDKNDVTMGDVTLFKNSNAARTFIRIRGGDYYTNGAPAAAGTIVQSELRIGTLANSTRMIECVADAVYSTVNNATDLGISTNQWKSVYAQTYFYDGTAWGLSVKNIWTHYNTFNGYRLMIKQTSQEIGVLPTSNQWNGFTFVDKNEQNTVSFQHAFLPEETRFTISMVDNVASHNSNSTVWIEYLRLTAYSGGSAFCIGADARPLVNNTYSLGSAGNVWSNLYSTHGTFTDTITVTNFTYAKNGTLVKGTQPTKTLYTGMYMCDKNGTAYKNNALGIVENSVDANNLVSTYIRAIKNEANSQVACEIAVRVDASGTPYTYAPTPAVADNSTKIATTAWVTGNKPILAWASRSAILASGTEYKRASGNSLFCGYFSDGAFNYTNATPPGVVAAGTYELYGSVSPATGSSGSNKIFGMWIRVA